MDSVKVKVSYRTLLYSKFRNYYHNNILMLCLLMMLQRLCWRLLENIWRYIMMLLPTVYLYYGKLHHKLNLDQNIGYYMILFKSYFSFIHYSYLMNLNFKIFWIREQLSHFIIQLLLIHYQFFVSSAI
jgi:hypothetical protein